MHGEICFGGVIVCCPSDLCQYLCVSVAPNCERQPGYKEAADSVLFSAFFRYLISFCKSFSGSVMAYPMRTDP